MESATSGRSEMLNWLFGLESFGIKLGLENMNMLLEKLGRPERTFRSIHVAGTNGKGSTSAFIASILNAEGYRTGLYTSPHFVQFEERIRINGQLISENEMLETAREVRRAAEELSREDGRLLTFFEVTTGIAFLYFSRKHVDYAVIEVGLGGRLDSTNVIEPMLSVITHVALEHTAYLGNTLKAIAFEKGGIIKRGVPVITAEENREALEEIVSIAHQRQAELCIMRELLDLSVLENSWGELRLDVIGSSEYSDVRSGLWGSYQLENIGLAVVAAEKLQQLGVYLSERSIKDGIANVNWKGRLQIAHAAKEYVFDSAHNPDAMRALSSSIRDVTRENFTVVLGILSDKNIEEMMRHVRHFSRSVICVSPKTKRARPVSDILDCAARNRLEAASASSVAEGMEKANSGSGKERVIVAGSLFTVGEAMEWWYAEIGEKLWI